jgi:exodeoxyribonuclease VII small subunit
MAPDDVEIPFPDVAGAEPSEQRGPWPEAQDRDVRREERDVVEAERRASPSAGDRRGVRPAGRCSDRPAASTLGYAEASARLDEIVGQLDRGTVDVDELETLFSEAIEIVEELDRRLRRTRARVEELAPRLDAVARGEPSSSRPGEPGAGPSDDNIGF